MKCHKLFTIFLIATVLSLTFLNPLLWQITQATYVFSNGFEEGNFTAWTSHPTSGFTNTISSTVVHHGSYSDKTTGGTVDGQSSETIKTITSGANYYGRGYVYFANLPDLTTSNGWWVGPSFETSGDSSIAGAGIRHRSSPERYNWVICSRPASSDSYYHGSDTTINAGQWYCLEIFCHISASATGWITLWVDDVLVLNQTGIVTSSKGNIAELAAICWTNAGAWSTTGVTVYHDCYVCDTSRIYSEGSSIVAGSNAGTSTTTVSTSCNFYCDWQTTGSNLSYYIFGTNNTGHWVNETETAFPTGQTYGWGNATKTLNSTVGVRVEWEVWANNTDDAWAASGLKYLVTTEITYGSITLGSHVGTTTTQKSASCTFYADWSCTDSTLDKYVFGTNITGAWVNETNSFTPSQTYAWSNITKTLPESGTVQWQFWANNTIGNSTTTTLKSLTVSSANLKFYQDWESVSSVPQPTSTWYSWSVPNEVDGINVGMYMVSDSASSVQGWIEPTQQDNSIGQLSGSTRCLGAKTQAGTMRYEFVLFNRPSSGYNEMVRLGLTSQVYLSEYIMFPSGWKMSSGSNDWYMLVQFDGGDYNMHPLHGLMIHDSIRTGTGNVTFYHAYRDTTDTEHEGSPVSVNINRGQWNHLEWFQTWSQTSAGTHIWCKWNGQLLWDCTGTMIDSVYGWGNITVTTLYSGNTDSEIEWGKNYHGSDSSVYTYWLDNVELWDAVPEGGVDNPPSYSSVAHNTTVENQPCQFSSKWTDDVGLSGAIFSWDGSSIWVNDTWSSLTGTLAWANATKTLPSADTVVHYRWYCNDSLNNWASTTTYPLTTTALGSNIVVLLNLPSDGDTEYPKTQNFTFTPIFAQSIINASLWLNLSGTWQAITWNSSAVQNNTACTISYTITVSAMYVWNIGVYNSTDCVFSSQNRSLIMILEPYYTNVTYSTTAADTACVFSSLWLDGDGLSGYIFGWWRADIAEWTNNTIVSMTGTTAWGNATKTLPSEGVYVSFKWYCVDTDGKWTTTTEFTFTILSNVTVILISPANTTYTTGTISVDFTASGGVIDQQWFNCKNLTNWIYSANQTYIEATSMTGFVNGTSYTFYAWANNTDGYEGNMTVMFSVAISLLSETGIIPIIHIPAMGLRVNEGVKLHDSYRNAWFGTSGIEASVKAWFYDNWFNYSVSGSGIQQINNNATKPNNVWIDGVNAPENSGWAYTSGTATITTATSNVALFYSYYSETLPPISEPPVFNTSYSLHNVIRPDGTPRLEQTLTDYILTNGNLTLQLNKTFGWITSFKYNDFEILPNEPPTPWPYRNQIAYSCDNGTYWNFDTPLINPVSSISSNAISIIFNLTSDVTNLTNVLLEYRLYSNCLEFRVLNYINITNTGNFTFMNRLGTNYSDWDSIIVAGGDHSYAEITQFNSADDYNGWFTYGYETIAHEIGRPMIMPYMQFIKSDLSMSIYCQNFFNHSYFQVWDNLAGHNFRTDLGWVLESPPLDYEVNRTFVFMFKQLNTETCWYQAIKDYQDETLESMNMPTNTNLDTDLRVMSLYDIHPGDWENDTRINAALDLNAKAMWLYGWQPNTESYPIDGNWTSRSDSLNLNATYVRSKIAEFKSLGFKVYLYVSDWTDFNATPSGYEGWLEKVNSSANGYYFGWALPDNHIAVRYAFANESFQEYYYELLWNLTQFYEPDGLALDWGGTGSLHTDIIDYGVGDHYFGLFNLTQALFKAGIHIVHNSGINTVGWFSDGTLFEDPGYCTWNQLELMSFRLYNITTWLLTTGHTPTDQTFEGETMWTNWALASGINRGFDYNFYDYMNTTLMENIKGLYDLFWWYSEGGTFPMYALYPSGNNFRVGANVFVNYMLISNKIWLIGFNNGTTGSLSIPMFTYGNANYNVQSLFAQETYGGQQIIDAYVMTVTPYTIFDRYFTDIAGPLLPFLFIIGMIGLTMLIVGPVWTWHKIKEKEYMSGLISGIVLMSLGFGFFVGWLFA